MSSHYFASSWYRALQQGEWVCRYDSHLRQVITTRMASECSTSAGSRKSFSVEDVLQMVDDADEPMMEGSDDEFGDIQEEIEVLQSDAMDVAPESTYLHAPSAVGSCATSLEDLEWSSKLSPIRIQPFTSTTGPGVQCFDGISAAS